MTMKQTIKRLKRGAFAVALCILAVIIFSLAGCTGGEKWEEGKLKCAVTTTMLTDLAKQIGGGRVHVRGLMNAGVDPHLYTAKPSDSTLISGSDIVVYNGLHLEGKIGDLLESSGNNRVSFAAGDALSEEDIMKAGGSPDPHIWFDVSLWKKVAAALSGAFTELDEAGGSYYASRLESYLAELDALDGYVKESIAKIPESGRVLVTAHDAFGYFGRAYGITVRAVQGISTATEAGIREINELADFIAERKIKAVFTESSVPKSTILALIEAVNSRGFNLKEGGLLYSDSIGDEKSGAPTYILSFKQNADTISSALK